MNKKTKKLNKNIFFPFTIIIILMIIILTVSLYVNYINRSYTIIYDNISDNLEDSGYSIYYMTTTVNNIISQLSINGRVRDIMYSTGNHTAMDLYNCQKTLSSYSLSSSVVNSIYVYNGNLGGFVTSYSNLGLIDENAFFDQDMVKRINDDTTIKKLNPITRDIEVQISPFQDISTQNLISYVYYESLNEGKINEAIIINVNQSYITNLLNDMNEGSANNKYIIDSDGNHILTDISYKESRVLNESLIKESILSSNSNKGYFVTVDNGSKTHISFHKLDFPKWILINETSLKSISQSFNDVLVTSLIISTILLVFSVILTTLISNWRYKPIEKVVDDLNILENEQTKNSLRIKQNYLRKLIINNIYSKVDQNELISNNVNVSFSQPICIVLIQYDNYAHYRKEKTIKEKNNDEIKTLEILSEILDENYCNDVFYVKDDTIAILVNTYDDFTVKALYNDCIELQGALTKVFKRSFTITIGPTVEDTSDINYYYLESLKAANLRMTNGIGNIFEYSELNDYDEQNADISLQYHKKIVDALLTGNKSNTLAYHNKFVQHLKNSSPLNVIFSYTRLSFLIYESVYYLLNDVQTDDFNLDKVIKTINNSETIYEIKKTFDNWFLYIHDIQEDLNKNKHRDLIDKIKLYISESFSDPNLSQSMIADIFNISNAYLGRLFRQMNNQSIATYINSIRLEEAKKSLIETNLSISDIANQIGILNSNYFYSMFKKRFGVTPSTFRKNIFR